MARSRPRLDARGVVPALILVACVLLGACSGQKRKPTSVQPVVRQVPQALRGTIGAEASFNGVEPVLVSGLGLVVGLNGTGGKPLPDRVAASMEREMGLKGIGKASEGYGSSIDHRTPRELLRDPNVAVVEVVGAVAPGSPAGATFDVFVRGVNAESLEGGLLWSTELNVGEARVFGAGKSRKLGEARGPIFINPFADPGNESAGVTRDRGRVLGGGRVTDPLKIEIVLDNASHQRAQAIVSAINSRYPLGPGDPGATAAGRGNPGRDAGPSIALRIPGRYTQKPEEFLELIRHLSIDDSAPEARARRCVESAKQEPLLAPHMAWCLEAIGDKAIPFCRDLYEYPEPQPRLAGLRAGARLGDNRATPFLKEIALTARGPERLEAIFLLGKIDGGPTVDITLKQLLAESDLTVRVSAYEALAARAERDRVATIEGVRGRNGYSPGSSLSPYHVQVLASSSLPPGTIQGIERELIADKFFLDVAPVGPPMVYVTQQGKPRIVLFGEEHKLRGPMLVSTWSDRFMLTSDSADQPPRLYYHDPRGDREIVTTIDGTVRDLVKLMARVRTPEDPRPGLGMSYSDIVGALEAIQSQTGGGEGGTFAFATESDRLRGLLAEAATASGTKDRPEKPGDVEDAVFIKAALTGANRPAPEDDRPRVVPIPPRGK